MSKPPADSTTGRPDESTHVLMSCDFVDRVLSKNFEKLGRKIAETPGHFIITPLLVIAILTTGIQRLKYEDDPAYLFAPLDGRSKTDRAVIDTIFPMNYSDNFHPGRTTKFGRFGHIILVPKDGGNVLRSEIFEEIVRLDEYIKNMTIEYDDEEYQYKDLCAKQQGKCFNNDILEFAPKIKEIEAREYHLKYPIWVNGDLLKVFFFPINLGGVKTDEEGMVETASAAGLYYFLDVSIKRGDVRGGLWEDAFLKHLDSFPAENITIAKFVSTSLKDELDSNTHIVLPFFSITVFVMGAFSVITCLMTDWVRSKPWLGLLGCLSAGISVAGAFGLCMYAGVEMISINLAAPFLMLGKRAVHHHQHDHHVSLLLFVCEKESGDGEGECLLLLVAHLVVDFVRSSLIQSPGSLFFLLNPSLSQLSLSFFTSSVHVRENRR